jgi:hypothetical protein
MSHEVQLNPAAPNSPAATLPSPAPAGHVTEAPETVTPYKSGFSGHFSQALADYRPRTGTGAAEPILTLTTPASPPSCPPPAEL